MVGGVCGGLGPYLGINPTLVRIFFVLLALADGIGILLYMTLWLLLPSEGQPEPATWEDNVRAGADEIGQRAQEIGGDIQRAIASPNPQASLIVGGILVVLGGIWLLRAIGFPWLGWLDFDVLWPVLLIIAGVAMLLRRTRE
jgi:phage shock protein PspC (stress-responsive transcriptional regulator)